MSKAGVGLSNLGMAFEAGKHAAEQAVEQLKGQKPTLALVFATSGYKQDDLMRGICDVVRDVTICGCSGEGIITQSGSDEGSHAVAVMLIASPGMKIHSYHLEQFSKDANACGQELARQIGATDFKGKMLMVFPDGVTGNGTEFIASLQKHLPYPLIIVGGAAGSIMEQMDKTYQYSNGSVYCDSISAVLIGGDIEPDVVVSHGCEPIGVELTVTKANGSYVEEINNRPAWEVFKEYLEGNPDDLLVDDLVHLCIGEQLPKGGAGADDQQHIIRTPIRLDPAKKALFVPGQLKTGAKIMMTRRSPERIAKNAVSYAEQLKKRHPHEEPVAMFQFDCAWRGRILFGNNITNKIINPVQEVFGKELPWTGFHTYGEIAPIGDKTYYHNVTVALCALYDQQNNTDQD